MQKKRVKPLKNNKISKMTEKQKYFTRQLMNKEGLAFMETELCLQFSQGAFNNLDSLTQEQTIALIAHLQTGDTKTAKEKMVGKILSMAHELRWELPNGKVDINRVNAWCIKYNPHKKPLNDFTEAELPSVVSVFERMYKGYLKKL